MLLYHRGNRESLARSGGAQQRLMAQTSGQAFAQLLDRDGLVSGRFEVGNEPEVGHFNLDSVDLKVYPDRKV
jgi:hypothetical protein